MAQGIPILKQSKRSGVGTGQDSTNSSGYLGGCTLSERLRLFVQDNTGKHASGVDSIIQQITKAFSISQHIHTPISDHMRKLILINYTVTVRIELFEPRQNVCVLEGLSHNHKRAPDFVAAMLKSVCPLFFIINEVDHRYISSHTCKKETNEENMR